MSIKLGIAPIAWSNDDMPELGGDTTLEQCLAEASKAGFTGIESGGKFPKKSNELMAHTYSYLYKLPTTGLRFFTVYGPWGRPDMAPFIFANAICEGRKAPVFNNGAMKRDFTYIDDIVDGVLGALAKPPEQDNETPPHRLLNIGNSRSEKLMDFIAALEKELDKKGDIEFLPMQAGDVAETYADTEKTSAITGFKAKTTIAEGVPKFVAWYRDYYGTKN